MMIDHDDLRCRLSGRLDRSEGLVDECTDLLGCASSADQFLKHDPARMNIRGWAEQLLHSYKKAVVHTERYYYKQSELKK